MATLEETVKLHKTKPWIRDFRRVLIRPLRKGQVLPEWLGERVRVGREAWYVPTDKFWVVHANASHPVGGQGGHGCSTAIHTAFLTADGKDAEFEYGYQRASDGNLVVETEEDFRAECAWWARRFGPRRGGAERYLYEYPPRAGGHSGPTPLEVGLLGLAGLSAAGLLACLIARR